VLEPSLGLSAVALDAIADLEGRTVAADGGRLKLEWGVLRGRDGTRIEDLLWWDGERLLGFLGLYAFGAPTVELAGMVDPAARRRGIGSALLDAARPLIHERGYTKTLLVCPRAGESGERFARSKGGELDHSEHALVLAGAPTDGRSDPATTLRAATADDADAVGALLRSGFGFTPPDVRAELAGDTRGESMMIVRDGAPIGYLRRTLHDGLGGVYGFVVDAAWRGRGVGRDVLRRVCRQLRADGAQRVGLEVEVDNEHALGLYTSLGFERATTEDYFRLS
jgi:ribosomal protein S18 acetylase RimI-like enzyme